LIELVAMSPTTTRSPERRHRAEQLDSIFLQRPRLLGKNPLILNLHLGRLAADVFG